MDWNKTLLASEGQKVIEAAEDTARHQFVQLQQGKAYFRVELHLARRAVGHLQICCHRLELTTKGLVKLARLKDEEKMSKEVERLLTDEVEQLRPIQRKLQEAGARILRPKRELALLRGKLRLPEAKEKRPAEPEVSLEDSRDSIAERKGLIAEQESQVHRIRAPDFDKSDTNLS